MSLYNNIADAAKDSGLFGALKSGLKGEVGGVIGGVVSKGLNNTEFGQAVIAGAAAKGISANDLSNQITGMATDYASGWIDKGIDKAESFVRKQIRSFLDGRLNFKGIPEKDRYRKFLSIKRARKNHFIMRFKSNLSGDISDTMDLFITDVELTPMNIVGEKQRVGGAFIDTPTGAEATELRITTLDDKAGTIKNWFEQQCAAVVARDGTFGLPKNYSISISVLHAFVNGEKDADSAFINKGLYRAANYEVQLSRREQAMQEVVLTFTQIDSFMR